MAQATAEQNGQAANQGGQPPKNRKIGLLPTASGGGEVVYKGKVVQETTWERLPARKLFSVSADGSHPYYKISKSSYADLITDEVTTAVPANAQTKVYRIALAG